MGDGDDIITELSVIAKLVYLKSFSGQPFKVVGC